MTNRLFLSPTTAELVSPRVEDRATRAALSVAFGRLELLEGELGAERDGRWAAEERLRELVDEVARGTRNGLEINSRCQLSRCRALLGPACGTHCVCTMTGALLVQGGVCACSSL